MECLKKYVPQNIRRLKRMFLLACLDFVLMIASYYFAMLLRFDFHFSDIPYQYLNGFLDTILVWSGCSIAVFIVCKLYNSILSLASIAELSAVLKAYVFLLPVYGVIINFYKLEMPRSYYVVGYLISFCMTTALRFSYRLFRFIRSNELGLWSYRKKEVTRVMLIGAGAASQMLIKELQSSDKLDTKACCVIDDNSFKWGKFIEGVEIVGGRDEIVPAAKKYKIDRIIYAIPSASVETRKQILNI